MTGLNEYFWFLPHEESEDDPIEIGILQSFFYDPIIAKVLSVLQEQGYKAALSDIIIPPDSEIFLAQLLPVFRVNVRFIKDLSTDTFIRIHFEHHDWHHLLPNSERHTFSIFLDRFRIVDSLTRRLDENWEGRKHICLSENPEHIEAADEDPPWSAKSAVELEIKLAQFIKVFTQISPQFDEY